MTYCRQFKKTEKKCQSGTCVTVNCNRLYSQTFLQLFAALIHLTGIAQTEQQRSNAEDSNQSFVPEKHSPDEVRECRKEILQDSQQMKHLKTRMEWNILTITM